MSVIARCPTPTLFFQDYLLAAGAWRETPVTCKPPSSSVFDAFAADINFGKKRSAATSNLPVTSHELLGCLLIPSPNSHKMGGSGRAWGWDGEHLVNLRNLAAQRFQGHLES